MTRKTFVLTGLLVILSGSLFASLQAYLMISRIIPLDWIFEGMLFRCVIVPVAFSILLWKWLRTAGKSKGFAALSFFGTLVAHYMWLIFQGFVWSGFDTSGILNSEISDLSKAGIEGEIIFAVKSKLKVAILTAINEVLGNWILFAALYLGASDPRSSKRLSQLNRLLNRIFFTRSTTTSTLNQSAYQPEISSV